MTRPYLPYSLRKLTEMAEATSDLELLSAALHELDHRKTQGAEQLSKRIRLRLESGEPQKFARPAAPAVGNPNNTYKKRTVSENTGIGNRARKMKRRAAVKPSKRPPTQEQVEAIDAFMSGEDLKVNAFAGTGKTSTLVQMANVRDGSGIYLAFNKSIADEARQDFPTWVDCRTTHSLALKGIRGSGGYSKQKLFSQIRAKQLAEVLSLKKSVVAQSVTLSDVQQAHLILSSIRSYCQSGSTDIGEEHVVETGRLLGLSEESKIEFKKWVTAEATKVWGRMLDPSDDIPLGHDGYLKLWSNSDPILNAEFILLDEAQDTNPAVMRVLRNQKAQQILVGDSHQQIYAWRGAIDAMEELKISREVYLTQSFRFGQPIADAASRVLHAMGEERPIRGNPEIRSEIISAGKTRAVLARTNSMVISEVLDALGLNLKPFIIGGTAEMFRMVGDVFNLKSGKPPEHPDFFGFSSWNQVVAFSETDEGADLVTFVSLVNKYGEAALYAALKKSESEEESADIVISTAHKAKGRQWPSVRLAGDFGDVQSETGKVPIDESRLFYVAMTRAQKTLCVSHEILEGFSKGKMATRSNKRVSERASPSPVISELERSEELGTPPHVDSVLDMEPARNDPPTKQEPEEPSPVVSELERSEHLSADSNNVEARLSCRTPDTKQPSMPNNSHLYKSKISVIWKLLAIFIFIAIFIIYIAPQHTKESNPLKANDLPSSRLPPIVSTIEIQRSPRLEPERTFSLGTSPQMLRLNETDLPGGDILPDGLKDFSFEECLNYCLRNNECVAVTWVSDKEWCWPKSSSTQQRLPKFGMTSAIKE